MVSLSCSAGSLNIGVYFNKIGVTGWNKTNTTPGFPEQNNILYN